MNNLLKMVDFIADLIYSVFDLIWHITIPGTNIQIVFILVVNLVIDLVIGFVLGSVAYSVRDKTRSNPHVNSINQNWGGSNRGKFFYSVEADGTVSKGRK